MMVFSKGIVVLSALTFAAVGFSVGWNLGRSNPLASDQSVEVHPRISFPLPAGEEESGTDAERYCQGMGMKPVRVVDFGFYSYECH